MSILSDTLTATAAATFALGAIVTDGCSLTDIDTTVNYAPLEDVKPAVHTGSFSSTTLSSKLVPMRDDNAPSDPPWQTSQGRGSTFWQSLDADVDGTDTTETVDIAGGVTPGGNLRVGLSSVPGTYGTVTSLKIRFRLTGDMAAATADDPIDNCKLDVVLTDGRDDSSIYSGIIDVSDEDWDNDEYEVEVTGLSLDPLTVNAIEASFGFRLNLVGPPASVGTPAVTIYAVDVQVFTINTEKQIPATAWTEDEKAIPETGWEEKEIPVAGWGEKEIPNTGWTAGEKDIK